MIPYIHKKTIFTQNNIRTPILLHNIRYKSAIYIPSTECFYIHRNVCFPNYMDIKVYPIVLNIFVFM